MKVKAITLLAVVAMVAALFTGCGSDKPAASNDSQNNNKPADVTTTASLVNKEDAFLNAISTKGTWIICTLQDMKIDKELVVEGEFHDKAVATNKIYRKLGLYAQDANKNVTARYTLTAPKMTVKSESFKIQGGTFVGDVYVEAKGFVLTDATIQGNVYFASQEYKDSADLTKGKVTGAAEVK
jgi:hypothetical protein